MPVRVGNPITLGGLVEEYRSPLYATAVGLVLLGAEESAPEERQGPRGSSRGVERPGKGKPASDGGRLGRIVDWIKNGFF
jgi:cell division protein FtsA